MQQSPTRAPLTGREVGHMPSTSKRTADEQVRAAGRKLTAISHAQAVAITVRERLMVV